MSTQIGGQKRQKFKDYSKILAVDDKYKLQSQQITKVGYLIEKKTKQKEKKKRLQMMQEQFQRQRKLKISKLEQKIQQSQKAKQTQMKQKLQKNKRNLQLVQKVNQKIHNQYQETISQGLQQRKKFYSERKKETKTETSEAKSRNKINLTINYSQLNTSRTSNEIKTHRTDIDKAIKNIEEKINKANKNHEIHQKQILSKLYEKDKNYSEIKEKIISHSFMEEQKKLKQALGKNQNIYEASQKVKQLTQKHLSQRRKSFQQKIKKIHQNIKYLEEEKQEKFVHLQNKFNKIYEPTINHRKTSKTQSNRQKILLNNLKLEQEKKQKADQILKKHAQITVKNKIYKEKKNQILQTINKVNPQRNN